MSLSHIDRVQFKILDDKLNAIDSEEQINDFIKFIKHHQFSSDVIRLGSDYRHLSIVSMALKHGFEPLIKRLMIEQFSIEPTDRIYNIEKLIKNFYLYDNFNQNNALSAMICHICNKSLGHSKKGVHKKFDELKQQFDLNHISIKEMEVDDRVFPLILNIPDSLCIDMNINENQLLMDIIQQGIKHNVTPKSKTQLNILKRCGFFDMYADHIKKQLLIAELLSDGEELIVINNDQLNEIHSDFTIE